MAEYQHVQFAVDAPLSDAQLAQVRALTTRARLTRHSLINTYSWGNFKGDPQHLIDQQNARDAFTAGCARFLGLHRTKKALLRELRAAAPRLAGLTPRR
ncbi:hypothetical protein [Streptomyces spectabilis]|uniref:Uncharacterized protein n=1 Tax=Streptomyces spectabilis TaxID=68270 RepID=A0A7W8B4B8_STRST|nr:hypothetical protein [Streptomyces spectabilis]MBB5109697.1 hypothetical protein [Streptomyces spectabilis]GGV57888.1 hypothetical protein GCM10010245_91030 [Streptomyces spectabilis]